MSYYGYIFDAPVERLPIGNGPKILHYNVIILPDHLIQSLPFGMFPKLRVIGEIADHPVRGAWNPVADGRKYFILSQKFLDSAGLNVGDMTEMRFNIDNQDHVDVPIELETLLASNAEASQIWSNLTPGKKRFYYYQISSAKQQATRQKRLQTVLKTIQE